MGIFKLFFYIYNNYPESVIKLQAQNTFKSLNLEIDVFSLDLNALFHDCAQIVYQYGKGEVKSNRMLHKKINIKKPLPHESILFSSICKLIILLCNIVCPKKYLILAIDGVAGLSKQAQQRQRRFISSRDKNNNEKETFDSSVITTGSKFMYNLSHYIFKFINKQMESEWKHLNVIFSNEKVPGEGEHTIIRLVDKYKDYTHCIYSPDADLVMLTSGLEMNKNIYILRENVFDNINCKYFIINVNIFKNNIISQIKWDKCNHHLLLLDFIFICFFLGNDFLPGIPSVDILKLSNILEIYSHNKLHLLYRDINKQLCIHTPNFKKFLYILSLTEESYLNIKLNSNINFPDTILHNSKESIIINTTTFSKSPKLVLNFNKYQTDYYKIRLHDTPKKTVSSEYLKGLLFIIRYYIDGMPDWNWYYPYHYSPFFVDLYNEIDNFNGEMTFNKNKPLTPFEQLLGVLPKKSNHILPDACKILYEDTSPIIDFYPDTFKVDCEGKSQEYEGHAILPFIDVARLQSSFSKIKHQISENDMKRNKLGKNASFINKDGKILTSFFV